MKTAEEAFMMISEYVKKWLEILPEMERNVVVEIFGLETGIAKPVAVVAKQFHISENEVSEFAFSAVKKFRSRNL